MLKNFSLYLAETMISDTFSNALRLEPLTSRVDYTPLHKNYMLYIHVPFCHDSCAFCSFHKFKYNAQLARNYFKSLRKEMRIIHEKGLNFDRLYVGGGTPLIHPEELFETLELAKKLFNITEISCESSPSTIAPSTLHQASGLIDRLSIGIQTFDDTLLKQMGRYERYGSSVALQEKLASIKGIIPTISLDLIFNFPLQTKAMLKEDLRIAKSLCVDQITTYPLMRSSMMKQKINQIFGSVERTKEWEFYRIIRDEMDDYALNNAWAFAKEKSTLNDEYVVHYPEYVGIGSGAFSFLNNHLYVNAYDLDEYSAKVQQNQHSIIASSQSFSHKQHIQYAFLVQLFSGKVDIGYFNERFNISLEKILRSELWWLERNQAIVKDSKTISTTLFGDFLCLTMMKTFYSQMDNVRAYLTKQFSQKVS